MNQNLSSKIIGKAKTIRLAIFDVDGVLTDGGLYLGENGNEYKVFNSRDGLGLVMLKESGCQLAVISGRSSKIVSERMDALDIEFVYQGQNNKAEALTELSIKLDVPLEFVAYVGDDFIDLPVMRRAGLAIAVADAHPLVKEAADHVTDLPGGRGAAREVCELIMRCQGTFDEMLGRYLDT